MSTKIGNARYGGEFKKRNWFKLKDGESAFRILPPLGSLADAGRWSAFYSVHYGYKNSQEKMRPFVSPLVKNKQTKMVEVRDFALERLDTLKAELNKAKEAKDQPMIERLSKLVGGMKPVYNLDSNHYMNVVDTQGNIGVLKLRHRAKLVLDNAIRKLRDGGVDPLSVENGRFFVFTRSGMGLDTTFQVSVLQEERNIEGIGKVYIDKPHVLTTEIINRLGTEAAELDKLFKKPTSEEVERIVKGGAKAVDEILDATSNSEDDTPDSEYQEPTATVVTSSLNVGIPATGHTVTTQPTTPTTAVVHTTPTAVASTPAPTPPAATISQPTSVNSGLVQNITTTAQKIENQSDDEFLRSLGL